jgi:hypothetical protein
VFDEPGGEVVTVQERAVADEQLGACFEPVKAGAGAAGGAHVGLGEFAVRGGEADLESLGFAGPAFVFGLGDAGEEVVADVFQAGPLRGVDSQERASDECSWMQLVE